MKLNILRLHNLSIKRRSSAVRKSVLTLRKWVTISVACISLGFSASAATKSQDKFVVVIDAGHGGHDVGAVDNGVREKDINLGVALKLGELIKKKMKSAQVVFTRDDDTFVSLQGRADIANKAKGDLFISIHTNSVDKSNKNRTTVAGASVYALGLHKDDNNMAVARRENSVIALEENYKQKYQGFDPSKDESYILFEMAQKKNLSKSLRFAGDVQKQLVSHAGRRDRGVHQAGFWVLWATSMPAVLIEVDFICNPESAKFISSKEGQEKLATAIFNAVKNYEESYHSIGGNRAMIEAKEAEANKEVYAAASQAQEEMEALEYFSDKPSAPPTTASIDSETKYDETAAATLRASSASDNRIASRANTNQNRRPAAPRKRRSEASKRVSDAREIETTGIALHSETERYAVASPVNVEEVAMTEPVKTEKQTKKGKKEKVKKTPARRTDRSQSSVPKAKRQSLKTLYKIQILASEEILKQNNELFQGLKPVSAIHENNIYKYTYGESENKSEIEALLIKVKDKFPDAFIIKCLN